MPFSTSAIPKAIEPAFPKYSRGTTSALSRVYRVNSSQTFKRGDVVLASSGKANVQGATSDLTITATLLGIAASDLASVTTAGEGDILQVYDGAGNVFIANAVGGVATDVTVTDYSDFLVARNVLRTTDPSGKEVFAVDFVGAAVAAEALVIDLVRKAGDAPGDSKVNPRIYFVFKESGSFLSQVA